MKTIRLIGEAREELGSKATRAVRESGFVPCVLYGKGTLVHFKVHKHDFKDLIYTPNTYLTRIEVGGQSYKAIVQDVQFHPVNDALHHVDFVSISEDKPITVHLPVRAHGNSPGVRAGGKLLVKLKKLRVRGLIKDLPDFIDISIDHVELGKSVKVNEIKVAGVEFLDSPVNAVLSVVTTRATRQADEEKAKEEAKGKK